MAAPTIHSDKAAMRNRGRQRWNLWIVTLVSVQLLLGCTSLKPVAQFGSNASAVLTYPDVANDYPEVLVRSKVAGESGPGVSDEKIAARKRDAQRFLEAQKVLADYAKALGGLAADDLSDYDKQVDALTESLVNGKFIPSDEANRSASTAKLGLRLFTDLFRRSKIEQLISTYNPPVQKAASQMTEIIEAYLLSLDAEQQTYDQLVCARLQKSARSLNVEGLNEFIAVACADHKKQLTLKAATATALEEALKIFARGHQKLADNAGKVNLKELVATAGHYGDQLQRLIMSFKSQG